MPAEDLVTIQKFADAHEANMARAMLEAHGITGQVVGGEMSNMLWHLGPTIGGVELKVPASVATEAAGILSEFRLAQDSADRQDWICPRCGEEIEAEFEVCWSCGATIDDDPIADPQTPAAESPDADETELPERITSADEQVRRALKAAAYGIMLFPFLFYAIYLLVRLSKEDLSNRSAVKKYYAATAIVLFLMMEWFLFFRFFVTS